MVKKATIANLPSKPPVAEKVDEYVYQCGSCQTVYDPAMGEPGNEITPGTPFENLVPGYVCPVCETGKESFTKIKKSVLNL